MKTLTGRLPMKYRSAVRFMLVGAFGTALQYGIYYLLLGIFNYRWPNMAILTSVAFTCGYLVEMISNYLLTSFYTFRVKPSLKNASGFIFGRTLNYFIQMFLLHALMWLEMSEEWAGLAAIALAGIINYFVLLPFYKDRKRNSQKKEQITTPSEEETE